MAARTLLPATGTASTDTDRFDRLEEPMENRGGSIVTQVILTKKTTKHLHDLVPLCSYYLLEMYNKNGETERQKCGSEEGATHAKAECGSEEGATHAKAECGSEEGATHAKAACPLPP